MAGQKLEFEVSGLVLRGRLYQPAAPKPTAVLFLHGWDGLPNDDAAGFLAEHGYTTMTFSFSGHNESEGQLENVSRAGSLKEALAAYDLFKNKLAKETEIGVAGTSYGSYLAAILSGEREVAALSLRVPANYPDERFDEAQLPQAPSPSNKLLNEWRKQPINYEQTRSLRSLHDFSGKVQIIEAEKDEIVPAQTVQNYVKAVKHKNQLDYHFMKDWTHGIGLDLKRNRQYQNILLNWLEQKI